jgi:GNAT superfamily N-acetyltransferase
MTYVIRPYVESDQAWVLQCEVDLQEHERALHDARLTGLPHSRDYLEMLWRDLAEGRGAMLIGEGGDGKRHGFVAGHIVDEPWPTETRDSTRYGYVSDVFVCPDARGNGLAQALFDAIAAHFLRVDPDLSRLRVNVLAVNAMARRAYEKAGFAPYEVMYERPLRRA